MIWINSRKVIDEYQNLNDYDFYGNKIKSKNKHRGLSLQSHNVQSSHKNDSRNSDIVLPSLG
jgi:hypothetical protein